MRPRRRQRTGGRGGAEPRGRIQARETEAWHLHLRGHSQREIAEHLRISQPAVSKILGRITDRYAAQLLADTGRARARGHARFAFLYRQCVDGWERSARDHTRRRQRRTDGGEGARGGAPLQVTELTVEARAGDPRFLREAKEVTAAELQLLDRLATAAPAPPAITLNLAALTDEQLAVVERLVAQAAGGRAASAGPRTSDTSVGTDPPQEDGP